MEQPDLCETCRFWSIDGVAGDGDVPGNSGECRRHAPGLILAQVPNALRKETHTPSGVPGEGEEDEDIRRVWPFTFSWDWCGEWQSPGPVPAPAPAPVDAQVLAMPLRDLFTGWHGDTRIRKVFKRLNIHTVDDLVKRRADKLLEQKHFGEVSLRRVRSVLLGLGLRLHGE